MLLILSENAIASDWVEDEVSKAFAEERERKQIMLFPIRLDDAVMQTAEPWARKLRDQRNIGDFTRWKDHDSYQKSFERRDARSEGAAGSQELERFHNGPSAKLVARCFMRAGRLGCRNDALRAGWAAFGLEALMANEEHVARLKQGVKPGTHGVRETVTFIRTSAGRTSASEPQ